jgi:hypothetical protein
MASQDSATQPRTYRQIRSDVPHSILRANPASTSTRPVIIHNRSRFNLLPPAFKLVYQILSKEPKAFQQLLEEGLSLHRGDTSSTQAAESILGTAASQTSVEATPGRERRRKGDKGLFGASKILANASKPTMKEIRKATATMNRIPEGHPFISAK